MTDDLRAVMCPLVRRLVEASGGVDAVAGVLGVSADRVEAACNEDGDKLLTMEQIRTLEAALGRSFVFAGLAAAITADRRAKTAPHTMREAWIKHLDAKALVCSSASARLQAVAPVSVNRARQLGNLASDALSVAEAALDAALAVPGNEPEKVSLCEQAGANLVEARLGADAALGLARRIH